LEEAVHTAPPQNRLEALQKLDALRSEGSQRQERHGRSRSQAGGGPRRRRISNLRADRFQFPWRRLTLMVTVRLTWRWHWITRIKVRSS
jgi:hypothetical protein